MITLSLKELVQIYDIGTSPSLHHKVGSSLPKVFASGSVSCKTGRFKITWI